MKSKLDELYNRLWQKQSTADIESGSTGPMFEINDIFFEGVDSVVEDLDAAIKDIMSALKLVTKGNDEENVQHPGKYLKKE